MRGSGSAAGRRRFPDRHPRPSAKLKIIYLILIFSTSVANSFGAAAQEKRQTFAGLWQGVDVVDGSLRTLSISGPDRDGLYEVNAYDTYWTLCRDGRAVSNGSGKVTAEGLRTRGVVRCTDGRETAIETLFRPERFIEEGVIIEEVIGTDSRNRLFRINR